MSLSVAKTSGLICRKFLPHRIISYSHFALAGYSVPTQHWTKSPGKNTKYLSSLLKTNHQKKKKTLSLMMYYSKEVPLYVMEI